MKITLEGKEYEFDVKKAELEGFLKEIPPRRVISLGQKYKNRNTGKIYIIARTGFGQVNLINMKTGDRFGESTDIDYADNINDTEFSKMTDYNSHLFDFVDVEITVKQ